MSSGCGPGPTRRCDQDVDASAEPPRRLGQRAIVASRKTSVRTPAPPRSNSAAMRLCAFAIESAITPWRLATNRLAIRRRKPDAAPVDDGDLARQTAVAVSQPAPVMTSFSARTSAEVQADRKLGAA